ncbi:MAG TPA: tetratricopeptide repeat protein [Terriglobales bacterium]|nr:tetratricopeptide repeat protein [Terriglobales bacterium]
MKPAQGILQLPQALATRNIGAGIEILRTNGKLIHSLSPSDEGSAVFVGYLAECVDVGIADATFLKRLLHRYSSSLRVTLPLADYLYLRTADGVVAMFEREFEQAIRHFSAVLALGDDIQDKALVAVLNFWIGRCLRQEARYEDALNYVIRARKLASDLNYPRMAAVVQVLEAWIVFQADKPNEALAILRESEATLSGSDDYTTLGHIQSVYGRIARRQGRFQQALRHFEKAIELYQKRDLQHRNVARSLVNIAYVKRHIALHLRCRLDNKVEHKRKTVRNAGASASSSREQERGQFEALHEQAFAHLADAMDTYRRLKDHRGIGGVHITRSYLYLDEGVLDRALADASEAFELGAQKKDYVLQSRARILQSAVEMAWFEEQLEENPDHDHPAEAASDFAREAVEFAKCTQSRRLLAKAFIALGQTVSSDFYQDLAAGERCCDKATALLDRKNQDYVWRELQSLKQKVLRTERIDSKLRAWSQGIVGDSSFQQISEEFAAMIIPNVWKRENRKISKVAERLSISPKKVRRILRKVGIGILSGDVSVAEEPGWPPSPRRDNRAKKSRRVHQGDSQFTTETREFASSGGNAVRHTNSRSHAKVGI